MSVFSGATVLITGGSGSFGRSFTRLLLDTTDVETIRIFSRDEWKQSEMAREFNHKVGDRLRFLIGDVRDRDRLMRAFYGVNIVVHAAAMKRIEVVAYNPREAFLTNCMGTSHAIDAAIDCGVERFMALSSDKAPLAETLYGSTKAVLEGLVVHANSYSGQRQTAFSAARYGNIAASRGSVIPLFLEQAKSGRLTVTDLGMTRFWLSLDRATEWVRDCIEEMRGGEIFVPQAPSFFVTDLAKAVGPGCRIVEIGLRPGGERLHEVLITEAESRRTMKRETDFIIAPEQPSWQLAFPHWADPQDQFEYRSDTNHLWLSEQQLRDLLPDAVRAAA